jgi:hypothetical protein
VTPGRLGFPFSPPSLAHPLFRRRLPIRRPLSLHAFKWRCFTFFFPNIVFLFASYRRRRSLPGRDGAPRSFIPERVTPRFACWPTRRATVQDAFLRRDVSHYRICYQIFFEEKKWRLAISLRSLSEVWVNSRNFNWKEKYLYCYKLKIFDYLLYP